MSRMADEAVHIGGSPARESYLVVERILDAAQAHRRGGDPSRLRLPVGERRLRRGLRRRPGIVFIGPPAAAIRAMGSKSEAKKIMEKAGVPVVPGYHGDDQSPRAARQRRPSASAIPVLIKAVGRRRRQGHARGRGAAKFADALAGAKREAKASFGDDHVLVEKYSDAAAPHRDPGVRRQRTATAVHLFERDCSIQRRHQKVIEEAPAPGMDPATARRRWARRPSRPPRRSAMSAPAPSSSSPNPGRRRFYFMEMNTRLQVEHPVTEMITGLDLVEWQLVVAAGEQLPLTQDELAIDGHAVEVRLYAEDPARDFLPSTGTLVHLRLPQRERARPRRHRRARGRCGHAVLRSDDRQGDRARPRPRPRRCGAWRR